MWKKIKYQGKKIEVKIAKLVGESHDYIDDFNGIIMVDIIPPKDMYHPLLPVFDSDSKKCLFSCEPIVGKVFLSPMLKVAIKYGYRVTKIYRADRYKMLPSKWIGLLGAMYKIKYYSSKNQSDMSEDLQEHHRAFYHDNFGIALDFNQCEKRPALKRSSKVLINAPWGKHAESVTILKQCY